MRITAIQNARLTVCVLLALGCCSAVCAQGAAGSAPRAPAPRAEDLIGRPVDLDFSKGVQAPYRDVTKLPTTFEAAAKTQPVDPAWGTRAYHPKSRRDLTGIWINQGGIGWTPGIPPGRGQNPPLTPAYAKMFEGHLADAAPGKPTGDPTASCLPPGMPRIMTMTYPMEITMGPDRIMIYARMGRTGAANLHRRPAAVANPDPTYNGQSVGHWEGNFLLSTAYGLRLETNMESSGLPKSDKAIAYERIWLADDDTLRDEFTLVDPVALEQTLDRHQDLQAGTTGFRDRALCVPGEQPQSDCSRRLHSRGLAGR